MECFFKRRDDVAGSVCLTHVDSWRQPDVDVYHGQMPYLAAIE